jgi:hypothetical protein
VPMLINVAKGGFLSRRFSLIILVLTDRTIRSMVLASILSAFKFLAIDLLSGPASKRIVRESPAIVVVMRNDRPWAPRYAYAVSGIKDKQKAVRVPIRGAPQQLIRFTRGPIRHMKYSLTWD